MASFYLTTDNWEKGEFTLFDMGTGSSTMKMNLKIIFRKNQKLLYVFDF